MKTRDIIILTILIILFLVSFFVFIGKGIIYNKVLQPSWNSFKVDCGLEERMPGVNILGEFSVNLSSNDTKIKIYIDKSHPFYQVVLQHEECHEEQFKEGRFYFCNDPIGVYINEVECYIDIL